MGNVAEVRILKFLPICKGSGDGNGSKPLAPLPEVGYVAVTVKVAGFTERSHVQVN
jgi:hypothetical protein